MTRIPMTLAGGGAAGAPAPTCPTDDCTACGGVMYVDVNFATCGCGTFTGTFSPTAANEGAEPLTECVWYGSNGNQYVDDGAACSLRFDDIFCAFGYWEFNLAVDDGDTIGEAEYKRVSTGNGDCPEGTYTKDSSSCTEGSDTFPTNLTVYSS